MGESQTESVLVKFLYATIETPSDKMLKTAPIKSTKFRKFEPSFNKRSEPTHIDQWES